MRHYIGQNQFSKPSVAMQPRNMVQTESNKRLLLVETLPAKIEFFLGIRIYFLCPSFPISTSEIMIKLQGKNWRYCCLLVTQLT